MHRLLHRILNRKLASHLWLLLLIVITFLQSGCSNLSLQQKPQAGATEDPDILKVLVWNAWRGGNEVTEGPEKILKVIRDSEADVVLMQESYDINGERPLLGAWLAEQLG